MTRQGTGGTAESSAGPGWTAGSGWTAWSAERLPRALTIAGSDSGGGAGIQADLKTMQELGVFGMSALTAVTAQNSVGVHGVYSIPPDGIAAQIEAVLTDIGADAVKTGMLHDADVIETVAGVLRRHSVPRLIVDPVMIAKGGASLLREDAVDALKRELLPLAELVTPNIPEACALLGISEHEIRSERDMAAAAQALLGCGSRNVLLKGGHLPWAEGTDGADGSGECPDVLAGEAAGEPLVLRMPRIRTRHTHGTGCTLSAAIAAYRAAGQPLEQAVRSAKAFVALAIRHAFPTGAGIGSLRHAAHRLSSAALQPEQRQAQHG